MKLSASSPLIVILIYALALGACASRTVPLQYPTPIPTTADVAATESAIHTALAQRGWAVESQQPGEIVAVLQVRKHRLWAVIHYDERAIHIGLLRTERLLQRTEGNVTLIHRRVNTWLENLAQDIRVQLARAPAPG